VLSNFRTHLGSVTINCLLTAENKIKFSIFLLDLIDSTFQGIAGCQSICTTECTVTYQICPVTANCQTFFQCCCCLLRSHRKKGNFCSRYSIFDSCSNLQCICIKRIHNAGYACTNQCIGNRINFDFCSIRNLLYTNQYIHFQHLI